MISPLLPQLVALFLTINWYGFISSNALFPSPPSSSFFFFLLGERPQHTEVPRLGVESELQQPARTTATATWDPSLICDLYHSNASSLTHGARPGIEPISSWILVGFIIAEPQWELPFSSFFFSFCLFRATPLAYGGSQARGRIGAVAASLCQRHSNAGSKSYLRPTPQLTATPVP